MTRLDPPSGVFFQHYKAIVFISQDDPEVIGVKPYLTETFHPVPGADPDPLPILKSQDMHQGREGSFGDPKFLLGQHNEASTRSDKNSILLRRAEPQHGAFGVEHEKVEPQKLVRGSMPSIDLVP
jgi:hypothetical protein